MKITQALVDEILVNFYAHNVKWRVDGRLQEPSEDDVRRVLDNLYQIVYDGDNGMQASTGGILVQKNEGHLDLFIHIGEFNAKD